MTREPPVDTAAASVPRPAPSNPAQIVARIRQEHWEIEQDLREIENFAAKVQRGDQDAAVALRDRLQALEWMIHSHLHLEEYELVPLMRASELHDEASIDTLRRDHEAQRKLLGRVIAELRASRAGAKLAIETKELICALRDDMEHEEQELLQNIAE